MNLLTRNKVKLYSLLFVPLLVMAADITPATLPKGFLEKLPLLTQLNDEEFNQLLALAKTEQASTAGAKKVSVSQD